MGLLEGFVLKVFRLTGAVTLSVMVWAFFMSMQPQMYSAFESELGLEWNLYSGNNGDDGNRLLEKVWDETYYNSTVHSWVAYNENTD